MDKASGETGWKRRFVLWKRRPAELSDARLSRRGHHVHPAEAAEGGPRLGYARDFPPFIGTHCAAFASNSKICAYLANAGGVNPIAARAKSAALAPDLRVAVVLGDDILDRLDDILAWPGMSSGTWIRATPLATVRRQHSKCERLYRRFSLGGSSGNGRRRCYHRPLRRCGACARADDPRVRLEDRRLGTSRQSASPPAMSSSAAPRRRAATAPPTGRALPTSPTSVTR